MLDVSDYNAEFFGQWLRRKRLNRDLTVVQVAERAGISKQYVSMLERSPLHPVTGKPVQPALDKVEALAKALGADAEEARIVAGYDPSPDSEPVNTEGLFKGLDRLTPDQRRLAEKQIRAIIDAIADEPMSDEDFNYIDD